MDNRNVEAIYALSPVQESVILGQPGPDAAAHCRQLVCDLDGPLDAETLTRAWQIIFDRHAPLRTAFAWKHGGKPVQVVRRQLPPPFERHDWRGLTPGEQRERSEQLSLSERARGFNASAAPLTRLALCRLAEDAHRLVWTYHRLILDESSAALILGQLAACYGELAAGRGCDNAPAQGYAGYINWLSRQEQGEAEDFWRTHLDGLPAPTRSQAERPHTGADGGAGTLVSREVRLPAGVTESLRAAARAYEMSSAEVAQGAWVLLLGRYSGERDVVVGACVSGRPETLAGAESVVGSFANTVPLRMEVRPEAPASSWLKEFRERSGRVRRFGYVSPAQFRGWADVPPGPLFESCVEIDEPRGPDGRLSFGDGGLRLSGVRFIGEADCPLAARAVDGEELTLRATYDRARFDEAAVSGMLDHWGTLLEALAGDIEQPLGNLSLLSARELRRVLNDWNATASPYPKEACVHQLFEAEADRAPEAVALVFGRERLTYGELDRRSNQLAHHLKRLGVGPEVRVGLCVERSLEMIVGLLGILKVGGAYLPLDPGDPLERLGLILDETQAPVLLTQEHLLRALPVTWTHVICLDTEWETVAEESAERLPAGALPENLAYLMYTSGSTGRPKGVGVPHRAVVRLVKETNYASFSPDEVFLQLAPLSFDASTFEIWGALLNGARLALMPPHTPSLTELGEALKDYGVTTLWLTAGLFHLMVEHRLEDLRGLRQLIAGGDALSVSHVNRALRGLGGTALVNGYGPTESTTFACCCRLEEVPDDGRPAPIGSPISNTRVYVLDELLRPVPVGARGELYIGGDGLARGYFGSPALTAETFVPSPFGGAGERLYRTGDLARYLPDGRVEFLGRADGQVKIRGFRVEAREVEAALARHRSVRDSAVVARADGAARRLVAYVATDPQEQPTAAVLQAYLRERLPEYMVPSAVVLLERLPLTRNGKVDRNALPEPESIQPEPVETYAAPATLAEEILAAVWSQVLGVGRVGVDDNFFALGGDSIRSIQVVSLAEEKGLHLPVDKVFECQTIRELAREATTAGPGAAPPRGEAFSLVGEADRRKLPPDLEDAYPLTMLQAGMVFHSELSPESAHYHDILSYHLRAPFDPVVLEAVMRQLMTRHPMLRTSFDLRSYSEPLQLVHKSAPVPLRVYDLSQLPPAEQDAEMARWMEDEQKRPLDWGVAPLLRLYLHRRTDQSFQFTLSLHHAILDGWSVSNFQTDLFALYRAALHGHAEPPAPPPATTFRDFVALERQALASPEAKRFWAEKLEDSEPTVLPRWPFEPETSDPHLRTPSVTVPVSREVSEGLQRLADEAVVPLKSVLVAAHLRVLKLVSGQGDLVTGLVSHGRPETGDADQVMGLFLNALPLRIRLEGGTWAELVQQTFAAEREMLPHRWYPMAQIQNDMGGRPLYETAFTFTRFHTLQSFENLPGVEVLEGFEFAKTNIPFAPFFRREPSTSQLSLHLDYDPTQVSGEQVDAIARYYELTLTAMARNPRARHELSCLLPAEEQRLLRELNQTDAPPPAAATAHQLFERQAALTPDAVAAVAEHVTLTYGELDRRANQLAHHLRRLGVGPEVVVALCVEPSPEMLVGVLGIMKAGGSFVSLDPTYPLGRLALMLGETQAPVIVTEDRLLDLLPVHWGQVVCLDTDGDLLDALPTEAPDVKVEGQHPSYLVYTSGSTGSPKAIQATHAGLVNVAAAMIELSGLDATHRLLQFVSLSFDAAVQQIFMTLGSGASLALRRDVTEVPPLDLLDECQRLGVTTLYLPPAYWHQMVDELSAARRPVPESLKLLLVGGESPAAERLAKWAELSGHRTGFGNAYGPAEATVTATFYKAPQEPAALDALKKVPVGRPINNVRVYVLDPHMQPAPLGTPGELYIGGAGLARGYLNRPGLTAERFIPDPFADVPGSRLYRTGDLARLLPDGQIEFLGRADAQVKVRGFRVELAEVEAALLAHPGVREAAVAAQADGAAGARLVAYVVGGGGAWPGASTLREWVAGRLPGYMVPSVFVELEGLPLTPTGKVDRRALPQPGAAAGAGNGNGAGPVEPRTPVEALLAGVWAGVLGLPRVGVVDNFFELGGHSLSATQVVSRVREACGVEVTLRALFDSPTVEGLAAAVEAELRGGAAGGDGAVPRRGGAGPAPLSFAQQRLWFLDQLRPGNPFNNIPAAFRLEGALDVPLLERCLTEIVRRHEALRTSFRLVEGQPAQVIHPERPVSIPVRDLRHLPAGELEAEVKRQMAAEAQHPFDLGEWPLFRFTLLRLRDEEALALITVHHIISDGWSIGIVTRELAALYAAFAEGEPSPLPEVAVQYADFAVHQRDWLQGEVLETQLAYWTKQLERMPQVMALPADRPRPAVQSFRGARQTFELPEELSAGLAELSRRQGVTLFMTLLAAFEVLLHRYTGEVDLVVGTDVANRNRREVEEIVGFFVNQLVLRTDLSGDPTFGELLSRVRRVALEAYAHQDLPFERLVEALQPSRDLSHTPLFQVKFVMQNAPAEALRLPGLTLSFAEGDSGIARYDLILTMEETGGKLFGVLEYNTDLFEGATVGRLIRHYRAVLEDAAARPEQPISTLRLLSAAERRQLLVEWNATERRFPSGATVASLFEAQAARRPEAAAVVTDAGELSYGELNRRANQLAHHLRAMGVGPEVRVGVCLERGPEMVVGILGILKAGGAYVPLDPSYPLDRLSFMLADSQAPVIVTSEALVDKLPSTWAQTVLTDADADSIARQGGDDPAPVCAPDNLAYVIYTSGTTGVPKGVQVQHGGVCNLVAWQADNFRLDTQSRVLQIFSYNFDGAVGETFMALLNGATLVMLGADYLDPARLAEGINRHRITVGVFVPSMIRGLAPELLTDPARLSIVSVGEACPADLARRWAGAADFMNAYGPTEYTVYSHLWRVDDSELAGSVPIGTPIHNTRAYILDARLNPVPVGAVGELYLSGAGLARGYLNQAGATATKFVPNPFLIEQELSPLGPLALDSALRDIEDFRERMGGPAPAGGEERGVFQRLAPGAVLKLVGELDADLVEATRSFVEEYGGDEVAYDCFCRYLTEGARDSFASCGINRDVLRVLLPFEEFRGLRGVEFCFGNGELMQTLAAEGAAVKGFDLNPFFVHKARRKGLDAAMAKVDVPFELFAAGQGVAEGSQDFAISVLALDRTEAPARLLENLFRVLKTGGRFVVQTLLPIVPTDDGELENPITYTPPDNRITPGRTPEQDRQALSAMLYGLGARGIRVHQLPYVVASRDGVQTYDLWSFSGSKGTEPAAVSRGDGYERMYRTGDLARYLPDGRVEFLGRADQQVKLRGFRVELGEVEAALSSLPGVREAAVVAREGAGGGLRLVGYVAGEAGDELSAAALRRGLRERLPAHMVPEAFVTLDALPLTPNGKVDRDRLPSPDESRPELEAAFVPPRTDVERVIAGVWQEALKLEHVGVDDNFFELGGHSLLMIEVNTKLREKFERELTVTELFQYPTVASLAAYLTQEEGDAPSFEGSRERARKQHEAMSRRKERLRGRPGTQ